MKHPSSIELEAYACEPSGHDPRGAHAQVAAHLAVCAECCSHVERLTAFAQDTRPSVVDADARIAEALRQASDAPASDASEGGPRAEPSPRGQVRVLRPLRRLYTLATPLVAAAAIVFFFVRSRPDVQLGEPLPGGPGPSSSGEGHASTPDRIQMGQVPGSSTATVDPSTAAPGEPDITFKGSLQLAVVRDRRGEQTRFPTGTALHVHPGDRLRVEVALDREEAILGGVLADDGAYLELMPLAVRGPGLHLSERSAKIDGSPSNGTIIVGTPEAIARVRATRQVAGVTSLRVEWEAP